MKLTFLGATQTVTGSKYLLEHNQKKVLVDCGLFQGYKELRLRNWSKLPVDPATIDAVILTHAHIDHSGYIPLLVKNGFTGKIYCSRATFDLCKILLPDSGFLHEEDAKRANRYGYSRHHPAEPLYTEKQARESLKQFSTIEFGQPLIIDDDLSFTLSRSGHILGAAAISVMFGNRTLVFSGDLGRQNDPIMAPPAKLQHADYLVIESTYGDRLHENNSIDDIIAEVINSTIKKSGAILIPSFAVGRAQTVLYYIHKLKKEGKIPNIPVYLDSPMAISATSLMCRHKHEHRLTKEHCEHISDSAIYTRTSEESKTIDSSRPCIIISASGMATGGRVLHHLKKLVSNQKNTILFAGFQAGGTRGDRLVRGEQTIKIHGELFPVKARIENLDGMSAHADYAEILAWLENFQQPPGKVFITHGEAEASAALKDKIEKQFGWNATIPQYQQTEEL